MNALLLSVQVCSRWSHTSWRCDRPNSERSTGTPRHDHPTRCHRFTPNTDQKNNKEFQVCSEGIQLFIRSEMWRWYVCGLAENSIRPAAEEEPHSVHWGIQCIILYIGAYKETEWSLCDTYLPYALGGGYLLSRDLIELLVRNEPYLKHYKCEDVAVGVWLAPYNIERRHDSRFDTGSLPRGCKNVFLMSHKVGPEEMFAYYRSLQLEGQFCSWRTQWFYQNGYLYNWTALPSQCCLTQSGIP